jgi:hypothetical protein
MSKYWAAGEGIHFTENLPPHVYESAHDTLDESLIEVVGMCAPPNDGGEVEFAGMNPESFIKQ